jgi:hypothetical protein
MDGGNSNGRAIANPIVAAIRWKRSESKCIMASLSRIYPDLLEPGLGPEQKPFAVAPTLIISDRVLPQLLG